MTFFSLAVGLARFAIEEISDLANRADDRLFGAKRDAEWLEYKIDYFQRFWTDGTDIGDKRP